MPDETSKPDMTTLLYRIAELERQIHQLQDQLKNYVPARENELQLQNIQNSVSRIERDVIDMKNKQIIMEKESRDVYENQQKERSAVQLRVLIGIITFIFTIVSGIAVYYLTHFP